MQCHVTSHLRPVKNGQAREPSDGRHVAFSQQKMKNPESCPGRPRRAAKGTLALVQRAEASCEIKDACEDFF